MAEGEEQKQEQKQPLTQEEKEDAYQFTVIIFILVSFILVGLIALVWSFVCLGKTGTSFEKFIGIVIAFLTGPFYFIYYGFNTNYCRDIPAGSVGGKKKK